LFEPIHGSAPKYAGKQLVNPVAAIESVRLMMDHVGEAGAGADIETGLRRVLKAGNMKTRDMGGTNSTAEMGDAVKEAILSIDD
jgi:isocitrate/isopropylmalate dehydrogenase